MPLTETGYKRRTYDEILTAKIQKAQELFGDDIDTGEETPLGKYIRINAYDQAEAEEEIEAVYYARFPNTATGTSLDRLCVFAGISRNVATAATYKVKATGEAGKTVPVGFLVGTDTGLTYYNTNDTVIGEDGTCEFYAVCTLLGTIGNVDYTTINKIINPCAEVTQVIGVAYYSLGEEEESDAALRKRFEQAIQGAGSNNEPAIKAAIMRVPTVESVGIIVNETDETDSGNRPPRSFECYVTGGESYQQQIAETIFEKKPLGIKTYGTISKTVLDEGGYEHTIKFSQTENIDISVYIKIKKTSAYQSDGDSVIKTNIAEYIDSLPVGKDVIYSSLYGYIYSVTGVTEVTELKLSTDDGQTKTTSNITITDTQIARCKAVTIEAVTDNAI